MRAKYIAFLLLVFFQPTWAGAQETAAVDPQMKLLAPVKEYSLSADNFFEALAKVAQDFQLPLGIEWVMDKNTLRKVTFSLKDTTTANVVRSVVESYRGYKFEARDGVVHVFRRDLQNDRHNFLNLKLSDFEVRDELGGLADRVLQARVQAIVFPPPPLPPGARGGVGGSYAGPTSEKLVTLSLHDVTVREALDKLMLLSSYNVWVVTFVGGAGLTPTGFRRTATTWHAAPFADSEQPVWDLYDSARYPLPPAAAGPPPR